MDEPVYIAQTAEPMTNCERRRWFGICADEAKSKGVTWLRFSVNPDQSPVLGLVEGWLKRPKNEGEQRWQMTNL